MRKDDHSLDGKVAFMCLLVVTGAVLAFSLFRLMKHLQAAPPYRPLQAFYAVLCLFLTRIFQAVRVFYYLSPYLQYPDLLYYSLDMCPLALIYCVSGIVCYIWYLLGRRELSISFSPALVEDPNRQRLAAKYNFWLTIGLLLSCLGIFWLSFLFLYFYHPDSVVE
jgi:hypothetical protein